LRPAFFFLRISSPAIVFALLGFLPEGAEYDDAAPSYTFFFPQVFFFGLFPFSSRNYFSGAVPAQEVRSSPLNFEINRRLPFSLKRAKTTILNPNETSFFLYRAGLKVPTCSRWISFSPLGPFSFLPSETSCDSFFLHDYPSSTISSITFFVPRDSSFFYFFSYLLFHHVLFSFFQLYKSFLDESDSPHYFIAATWSVNFGPFFLSGSGLSP